MKESVNQQQSTEVAPLNNSEVDHEAVIIDSENHPEPTLENQPKILNVDMVDKSDSSDHIEVTENSPLATTDEVVESEDDNDELMVVEENIEENIIVDVVSDVNEQTSFEKQVESMDMDEAVDLTKSRSSDADNQVDLAYPYQWMVFVAL